MIELRFNCCHCGEENIQLFDVDYIELQLQTTNCEYCKKENIVTIVSRWEVSQVECE